MERIELLRSIARRHGVSPTQSSEPKLRNDTGDQEMRNDELSTESNHLIATTKPSTENTGQGLRLSETWSGNAESSTRPIVEGSPDRVAPNVAMMRQVLWQTMMDMKAGLISIDKAREVTQSANVIYKFVRLELDAAKLAQKKST